jgi:decaprenylphospho-beta-D-erythro-pentofuranosid-2-ulose 2-reductase
VSQKPIVPDGSERGGTVLILGATSGIARALAHELAGSGYDLLLGGRDREELETLAADLRLRYGVHSSVCLLDALALETHESFLDSCFTQARDPIAGVVLCIGYLGEQSLAQSDPREAQRILDTNFAACVSLLEGVASRLEQRGRGFICALSSVAGERGRQSNYLYGSAKGGLTIYLQGLRNRLFHSGVHVVTILPGFVDTPMTFGRPGMFLVASPETVARGICRAIRKKKNVAYLPAWWRIVMFMIRNVPETVFKRLRL